MFKVLGLRIVFIKMTKRVNLSLQDAQYEMWLKEAEKRQLTIHDFIKQAVRVYITASNKVQRRNEKK